MSPSLSTQRTAYRGFANAESSRQFALGDVAAGIQGSYLSDLGLRQQRRVDRFASVIRRNWLAPTTSLCRSVLIVIGVCSQEQMRGIATRFVVAAMTYTQVAVDWFVRQGIRQSVNAPLLTAIVDGAVSIGKERAGPFPALGRIVNAHLFPKRFGRIRRATAQFHYGYE